jgi:hypothetical protein
VNVLIGSSETVRKEKQSIKKNKYEHLKRHYESKACFLFIYLTIGKDKSIYNLVSLKISDTQCDPYLE